MRTRNLIVVLLAIVSVVGSARAQHSGGGTLERTWAALTLSRNVDSPPELVAEQRPALGTPFPHSSATLCGPVNRGAVPPYAQ